MDTNLWQSVEAALVLFAHLDHGFAGWLAVILFFLPDVSTAGYALRPKLGPVLYTSSMSTQSGGSCSPSA